MGLYVCQENNSKNECTCFTILANLLFSYGNYAALLSSNNRTGRLEVRLILAKLERSREQTTSTRTDWRVKLRELLRSCSPSFKIALVGVGQPLRGDDYVGSYAVKTIIETTDGTLPEGVYIFDAEDNVEALITRLAGLGLKHVVFIDACEMRARPGETNLLSVNETSYPFFTTHGIPLKVLAERLLSKSEVWLLAIQPKQAEFGDRLSSELRRAANSISEFIATNLAEGGLATAG